MNLELKEIRNKKHGRNLFRRFQNASTGLYYAYTSEQSMTIHLATVTLIVGLGILCGINRLEWLICIFLLGVIAATELINTSLEAVVDLICPQRHPLAKVAKDTASAAVFIYSLVAFIVWCMIFLPKLVLMVQHLFV